MRSVARLLLLALLAPVLATSLLVVTSSSASAADYFRYWTFYDVSGGKYVASQKGVGAVVPADGAVEAYRYAAPKDFKFPNLPRIDLTKVDFDKVCGSTKAESGQKRVAVLVDFGVDADAEGQKIPDALAKCAQVPTKATAMQTLQKVGDVRSQTQSMGPVLCGVDGFPAKGCADEKTATATPADDGFVSVSTPGDKTATSKSDSASSDDGGNTGLYVGIGVVVVLLLGGGLVLARRSRT